MTIETSDATSKATLRAAANGVSAHLIWQVTARVASFAIKAIVIRALGPAQFAFVEIRLGLLVSLALLPAIGAFRKVCLRVPDERTAASLAYLCSFVTVVVSVLLGTIAFYNDSINAASWAVVTASLVIRAFGEPPLVFARRRERYYQSSRARAVSTMVSGIGQALVVSFVSDPRWAKPASASGHVFYSASLGIAMYFATGPQRIPLLSFGEVRAFLRWEDIRMTGVVLGQSLLKFILENGEGIILDVTCPATVKGAYKLAGNFASIMARFFSEALEEQSFNVFHRLAPAFRNSKQLLSTDQTGREEEMRSTCLSTLSMALKAAIGVSVLIAFVGPAYSYSILRLLYGEDWADRTSAPALLNSYFVYLVFMAANGVSEAFVSASASTEELKLQTKFTTLLSICYVAALYVAALRFQATGIILVNCVNMALRTAYSAWFFQKLTGRSSLEFFRSALLHPGVIVSLFVTSRISKMSEKFFISGEPSFWSGVKMSLYERIALHSFSGLFAVTVFAWSVVKFESSFISQMRSLRSHQD